MTDKEIHQCDELAETNIYLRALNAELLAALRATRRLLLAKTYTMEEALDAEELFRAAIAKAEGK